MYMQMPPKQRVSRPSRGSTSSNPPSARGASYQIRDHLLSDCSLKPLSAKIRKPRPIIWGDFRSFGLEKMFMAACLHAYFDKAFHSVGYYPTLVRLFYANLKVVVNHDNGMISKLTSNVLGKSITVTPSLIGDLIGCPLNTMTLKDLRNNISVSRVNSLLFSPEHASQYSTLYYASHLCPTAKLVARMITWEISNKSGSFHQLSIDHAYFVYSVLSGTPINLAQLFMYTMAYLSDSTLPYVSLVTNILSVHDVPFGSHHKSTALDPFDTSTTMKMGLLRIPGGHLSDDEEMGHEDDPDAAGSDEDPDGADSDDGLDPGKGCSSYEPWGGSVGRPEMDDAFQHFDAACMNFDLRLDSISYNMSKLAKGQKRMEAKLDDYFRRGRR